VASGQYVSHLAEAPLNDPRSFHQLTLHVFEQDGGWHWGLTIERPHGVGEKVIAFSETVFHSEAEARTDGKRARELRRESFECAEQLEQVQPPVEAFQHDERQLMRRVTGYRSAHCLCVPPGPMRAAIAARMTGRSAGFAKW
jgi:hypothetical protein